MPVQSPCLSRVCRLLQKNGKFTPRPQEGRWKTPFVCGTEARNAKVGNLIGDDLLLTKHWAPTSPRSKGASGILSICL